MKIAVAEVADTPPRGAVLTRATGRRLAGDVAGADRTIDFVASTPEVARDGHRILADAWQLDNFLKNPVFLGFHLDDEPPIGRVISIRTVGNELRALVRFAPAEAYPFAGVVFDLYKGGFLNAVSVGFLPIDWKPANDRSRPGGVDFTAVELLEISAVCVPSLPTALASARAAGIDLAPLVRVADRALDSRRAPPSSRKELQMIRSAAGAPRAYASPRLPAARPTPGADPATGWRGFGEFLQAVARAAPDVAGADRRLVRAPAGLNEVDPAHGGFLVPPTFLDHLVGSIYDDAVIAPLCNKLETDRPAAAKMPGVDETSRVDGSRWGGASSYWDSETDTVSPSLPKWKSINFAAHKLFAVCITTAELLADAPMLAAYVERAFTAELSFKLDAAILSGSGAGLPLGVLKGAALITVPKAAGQQAATIVSENVESMWARLPTPSRKRAVWLVNEDAENQLSAVNAGGLNATGAALYVAAGVAGNETALLKGRPLIVCEQSPALGTPGDIVLADLSQYAIVQAPMKTDLSLDVLFSSDQGVFRFTWRVDGQPLWSSPIVPYNQTSIRSPFVALAQR